MADMREHWLLGFEDGAYVVYQRWCHSEYSRGFETGQEIGRATVLADALDQADRYERDEARAERMREQERLARLDAMSPEERAAHDAHIEKQAQLYRHLVDVTNAMLPFQSLPTTWATRVAAADSVTLRWRSLTEGA